MRMLSLGIVFIRLRLARWHGDARERHLAAVASYLGRADHAP